MDKKTRLLIYDSKQELVNDQMIEEKPNTGDYFCLGKEGEFPAVIVARFWKKGFLTVVASEVSGVPDYVADAMHRIN